MSTLFPGGGTISILQDCKRTCSLFQREILFLLSRITGIQLPFKRYSRTTDHFFLVRHTEMWQMSGKSTHNKLSFTHYWNAHTSPRSTEYSYINTLCLLVNIHWLLRVHSLNILELPGLSFALLLPLAFSHVDTKSNRAVWLLVLRSVQRYFVI